ncbi:arylformamidase [Methanolinea mesophila]|uniref:cyclase family protein n=1 Tax=Methanolinea mesophila TaxID=547055 RepID=UPI001AE739FB|nr:cyclase family protein [Methanolinea mesophila]MBP1928643.1 arylformamidase [Methanolinea mesophila]
MSVKWFDATRDLAPGVVVYPGDFIPRFCQEDRGRYLLSELCMSSHSGTHIDAPSHYLKDERSVEKIPPGQLIGKCRVLDMRDSGSEIGARDLEGRIEGAERVLLKTEFSGKKEFSSDYPALTPEAARMITGNGVVMVGIDSPSIESFSGTGEVHLELLSHGVVVVELLDLDAVPEGDYTVAALPLKLSGLDGAPCRVMLWKDEGE